MKWPPRIHDGDAYDATYDVRTTQGEDVHGEATFVQRFAPASVLDAGCGTGRVARELARRGMTTMGMDMNPAMLATARRKAPHLEWRLDDIATADAGRTFDAVLMAGNVMIFVRPGTEATVLHNMARHLNPGGVCIAGFQLHAGLTLDTYDALSDAAGLQRIERWATWECDPMKPGGQYAVSVHRLRSVTLPSPPG